MEIYKYTTTTESALKFMSEIGQNVALPASPTARTSAFVISTFLIHSTSFPSFYSNIKWRVS